MKQEKREGIIVKRRVSNMVKIDVTKHMLVPEHIILKEEEIENLLEELSISKGSLPKILMTDPVTKLIGAKEGDILKIIRDSPTTGKSVYYRFVVAH